MNRINVVAACDQKFVQHLGVMLSSLLRANLAHPIRFFVLTTAQSSELDGIRQIASAHPDCHLEFIAFDPSLFQALPSVRHLSQATYFRLAISSCLPKDVNRVIYLDCDILVKGDIEELWTINLKGMTVGAVEEMPEAIDPEKIRLPINSRYFNAGVLLIDLTKWNENKISDIALHVLQNEFSRTTWADQCALNIALNGKWLPLEKRWNLLTPMIGSMCGSRISLHENWQVLISCAVIIHFSTHSKPWHYANEHPAKHLYWDELKRTPWRGARPSGRLGYWVRKLLRSESKIFGFILRLLKK